MTEKVNYILPPLGTFFGAPACRNIGELSADIAFLGVPFELGKPLRTVAGQKEAPKAVRDVSTRLYLYEGLEWSFGGQDRAGGWFDANTGEWCLKGVTMADCGDVNIIPTEGMIDADRMTEAVRSILNRGAFPVMIGGDHTITYPLVRAFDKFDDIHLIQFDSHLDFNDSTQGVKITSGTSIRRCSELPFVNKITQIGLGTFRFDKWRKQESLDGALAYGSNIITINKFRQLGAKNVVESIPKAKHIYVTLDVDVFDPSVAPGISTPQLGGLTYYEVRDVLTGIATRGKVVGFDVVCILPRFDINNITARLGADLILDFLAAIFPSK